MLHITLGDRRSVRNDELGREVVGYSADMTDEELHEANRGCWVLGQRADREQYALFSYGGEVKQAMQIDDVVATSSNRRALVGPILRSGHPVHDRWVGKESPIRGNRNPVGYFDDVADRRPCACGCGQVLVKGDFASGHDQRAIHERIARIGSVRDFVDWFDCTYTG
jgi:hypothetical protein